MTIAREYFSRVLSPWVPGVDNPLIHFVHEFANPDGVAFDVGCGPGVFTAYLAQFFGKVIAIDRDPQMIEGSGELVEKLKSQGAQMGEIEFLCQDWTEWSKDSDLGNVDIVCAVNSILDPNIKKWRKMVHQLRDALSNTKCANDSGVLLAIFPSMEAQIHLLQLYVSELRRAGLDEEEIFRTIEDEFLIAHNFNPLLGTFSGRGDPAQKFCYKYELIWELGDAGFDVIEISKVVYSWEVCQQLDASYFPGKTEIWDWFVFAKPQTFC